jgi:hypothetical protein
LSALVPNWEPTGMVDQGASARTGSQPGW